MQIIQQVMKIYEFSEMTFAAAFNTLRTGDADLRFYFKTVQDG